MLRGLRRREVGSLAVAAASGQPRALLSVARRALPRRFTTGDVSSPARSTKDKDD